MALAVAQVECVIGHCSPVGHFPGKETELSEPPACKSICVTDHISSW